VRGAKPGDVVAINPIELTPFATGTILRDFGVLRRELPEPSLPVHDGRAWFAATQPISARSRRCAGSLKPSYAALTAAISTKRTPAMFDDQLRCGE
jgi:acetamidase/formamidase